MAIKAVQLTAAPVSLEEKKRFYEALKKMDPVFVQGELMISYGGAVSIFWRRIWSPILKAFEANGWTGVKGKLPGEVVFTKDGKWPTQVFRSGTYTFLNIPDNDATRDKDAEFEKLLKTMASALGFPKNVYTSSTQAIWNESSSKVRARLTSLLKNAEEMGFANEGSVNENPGPFYTNMATTYYHPNGWKLRVKDEGSSTMSVSLSYDARRG